MTIDEAVAHYKTPAALAAALGIEPEAISNWKRRGNVIPHPTQCQIQVISKGRLKADPMPKKEAKTA